MKMADYFFWLLNFFKGFGQAMNYKATSQLAYEAAEMEHSMALMLFGSFAGLPAPPVPLSLELLPVMGGSLEKLIVRASQTGNGLSELADIMGEP